MDVMESEILDAVLSVAGFDFGLTCNDKLMQRLLLIEFVSNFCWDLNVLEVGAAKMDFDLVAVSSTFSLIQMHRLDLGQKFKGCQPQLVFEFKLKH